MVPVFLLYFVRSASQGDLPRHPGAWILFVPLALLLLATWMSYFSFLASVSLSAPTFLRRAEG
jgi:hypothetical protein